MSSKILQKIYSSEKKSLLKLVLVQTLKRKTQIRQKTLKTLVLITLLLKEKLIKPPGLKKV